MFKKQRNVYFDDLSVCCCGILQKKNKNTTTEDSVWWQESIALSARIRGLFYSERRRPVSKNNIEKNYLVARANCTLSLAMHRLNAARGARVAVRRTREGNSQNSREKKSWKEKKKKVTKRWRWEGGKESSKSCRRRWRREY